MNFKIRLTAKDLYQFSMTHAYNGQSGIFTVICVLVGIMMVFRGTAAGGGMYYAMLGVLMIALFTIVTPLILYMKAKKQAAGNPMYQNETEYDLQEDGIHVVMGDQTGIIPWNQIFKIRHSRGMYILYTAKQSAFIYPDAALGEQKDEIMNYIYQHVPASTKLPKYAKRS